MRPGSPEGWVPTGAPATPPTDGLLLASRGSQAMVTVHCRERTTILHPGCQPGLPQAGDDIQEPGTTLGPWLLLSGWVMRGTGHFCTGPQCCAQPVPESCSTAPGRRGDVVKCPLQERGDIFVRKGHKGVKPSKHSPLLSASVSRVRKALRESLQKADRI